MVVLLLILIVARSAAADAPPPSSNASAPAIQNPGSLDPFYVLGDRYKTPFEDPPPLFRPGLPKFPPMPLQFPRLPAYVVTASRIPEAPEQVAATTRLFGEATLRTTPTLTIDNVLRTAPSFGLFRRSDSLTANPTAQGVSLRGLGPSGASRTLVLLDDVPLNDPFGGWVAWTKVPRDGLSRAEMITGGGGSAWGNATLGGAIQLFTVPARGEPVIVKRPPSVPGEGEFMWGVKGNIRLNATMGDYGTRSAEFEITQPTTNGAVQLLGRDFSTDGFALVAPERRGPIDIAAWSRHRWLAARWHERIHEKLDVTGSIRDYEEFRGNGTPYTRNGTREKFGSVTFLGQLSNDFAWTGIAYFQDQSFASTFSSVNATRTAETPASDQFAVPASSFGAAWTGDWWHEHGTRTSFGADARYVRGETRENFTYVNGAYTRQRVAGGRQIIAGLFAQHERPLATPLRLTLGARVDEWDESEGHRRETERATGASLRDDRYANRDGSEFSPSAGLIWTPAKAWRLRANGQQAFRRPTLNELYRPFRQGTTVVETNPDLRTERVTTAEIGAEWTLILPRLKQVLWEGTTVVGPATLVKSSTALPALTLGATTFWNDFHDAVGNVTLARGPGTFPLFGTLPAGGIGRQRLNLDRTRVQGLEFSASLRLTANLSFTAAALLNDATVRRASVAPKLVGNQVAQVPRRSATVGANWQAPGKIKLSPRVRWIGRQFEDDENTMILGEAVVLDVGISRPITKSVEVFVNVENAGNARVETGRSADGVVNIGTPRLAVGGLRGTW